MPGFNSEDGSNGFHAAGSPKQMTRHGVYWS